MDNLLEKYILPNIRRERTWQMPWITAHNALTGERYNDEILNFNVGDPRYVTVLQIDDAKLPTPPFTEMAMAGQEFGGGVSGMLFNVERVPGLSLEPMRYHTNFTRHDKADEIIRKYDGPRIIYENMGMPHYIWQSDKVVMPTSYRFPNTESYYSTLFHEMGHSTGIESRCNRETVSLMFDDITTDKWVYEEVVAEMIGAIVCHESGIDTIEDNTDYLSNVWHNFDPEQLLSAIRQAYEGAEWILKGE